MRFPEQRRAGHATMRIPTLVFLALVLPAVHLMAQVPSGWGVYSKLHSPGQTSLGGLTIFDPLNGISPCTSKPPFNAPFVAVTNLPSALVSPTTICGADSVLVHENDGSVVVGEVVYGQTINIYHLTLAGSAVTAARSYPLGNAPGLAEIQQMAWYQNLPLALLSTIVFSYSGVPNANSQGLALLSLRTGTITPVPVTPFPAGSINALAVNRAGNTAYFGIFTNTTATVYSVPLPAGGTPTLVASLTDGPYQLDLDQLGRVHVGTFNSGLFVFAPPFAPPAQKPTIPNATPQLNAMTIDRVSGDVLFASVMVTTPSQLFRWSAAGGAKLLPGMPAQDAATGMAIRSSMIPGAGQAGGAAPYSWVVAPNPGGTPMVGKTGFSLSATSTATASASLIGFSLGLGPTIPLGGATVVLAPPIVGITPMTRVGANYTLALPPIPPQTAFCGLTVFAQSVHQDPTGLASTPALAITMQ